MSARCAACHRRLRPAAPCPVHGGVPAPRETAAIGAAPEVPGYELGAYLGAGGFAEVWAARRLADGAALAVKLARGTTALVAARFEREAEGLRVVGAPWVPRFEAIGALADGRPYLVMEQLAGETLATWLEEREVAPAAADAAPMIERLLMSIEHLHACAQVHRDLKPENIMVCGDRIALLDLGLTAELKRDHLTRTGTVVGTPEYLAPERLLAQSGADGAAGDMYAVGVILFELLTLRLPFTGDAAAVELGHLTKRPPRLRDHAPASTALETLILGCLAKDPARRPTIAALRDAIMPALRAPADVLATSSARARTLPTSASSKQPAVLLCVDTATGISHVTEVIERHRGFVARQKDDRYVAVFAGALTEDPALHALAAARELTARGQGRAVLHLAPVVLRRRGTTVHALGPGIERPETWLPATAEAIATTPEVAPLLPELQRVAGADSASRLAGGLSDDEPPLLGRDDVLDAIQSAIGAALATRSPALVTIVGEPGVGKSRLLRETAARVAGATVTSAAPLHAHEVLASRCAVGGDRSLGDRLRLSAEQAPLVFCLDDIHQADHPTLEAIEYATLSSDRPCPLVIVVAASPRLELGHRRWGTRSHRHTRIALDALDETTASALAAELLRPAEYPPADALRRLVGWSDRNPARLVELVRALKREGYIKRPASGAGPWYLSTTELDRLPKSAPDQWIATRELESLPHELASAARVCAVIGATFDRDELVTLLDHLDQTGRATTNLDGDVVLAELQKRGLFVRDGERWGFRNDALHQAVYEQIDGSERTTLHAELLAIWRALPRSPIAIARIARHAAGAGERSLATDAWLEVGDHAHLAGEQVRADEAYSSALAVAEDSNQRERALAGRGRARWRIWQMRDALEDLAEARRLALDSEGGGADRALAYLLEESMALDWERETAEAIRRVELAAPFAAQTSDRRLAVRYAMALGRTRWREESIAEAIQLLADAARDARGLEDHETEIAALLLLACALAQTNDVAAAEQRFAEVIDLTTTLGDRLHLCAAYGNRLFLWIAKREPERAFEDLRQAIQLARELGNPNPELTATFNLAELQHWAGDDAEALPSARRAVELANRFQEAVRPICWLLLARIHAVRDEIEQAHAALEQVGAEAELPPSAQVLSQTLRHVIDRGQEWDAIVANARSAMTGEELMEILYWRARGLLRSGDPRRAAQHLDELETLLPEWPIWRRRTDELRRSMIPGG